MNEIQRILLSDMPLLITADGYRQLMLSAFPLVRPTEFLFGNPKTYRQECTEAFEAIKALCEGSGTSVTMDYGNEGLPADTVAYHRIWGLITADSSWRFSTKQFEKDLLAAEQNPQVTSHLLHVNSPGGEAWYLDRLSETMRQLQKPVLALYEMACSAAYHIACHAKKVYATTQFDFVGCIGTMISFYDFEDYYKKLGIKQVEARATRSDLKNKMFDDLVDGKPRQYIDEVLNPLNDDFLRTVRSQRPKLAALDDDAPVLRGETFFTNPAMEIGLCDGQCTLVEAVTECYQLGQQWSEATRKKQQLYQTY